MQKKFMNRKSELCNRKDTMDIKETIESANLACYIEEFENAIDHLVDRRDVILGGEIFFRKGDNYYFDGSSWYYNGDSFEDSALKAREYLEKLVDHKELIIIFITK